MIKVLFAHSDPKLADIYCTRLANFFSVAYALDGLAALRKFKLDRPGIVVSDYHLPFLSGLALLRFVRNQSAPISFIFFANPQNIHEALNSGANDWLDLSEATPDLLIDKIYRQVRLNQRLLNYAL